MRFSLNLFFSFMCILFLTEGQFRLKRHIYWVITGHSKLSIFVFFDSLYSIVCIYVRYLLFDTCIAANLTYDDVPAMYDCIFPCGLSCSSHDLAMEHHKAEWISHTAVCPRCVVIHHDVTILCFLKNVGWGVSENSIQLQCSKFV